MYIGSVHNSGFIKFDFFHRFISVQKKIIVAAHYWAPIPILHGSATYFIML